MFLIPSGCRRAPVKNISHSFMRHLSQTSASVSTFPDNFKMTTPRLKGSTKEEMDAVGYFFDKNSTPQLLAQRCIDMLTAQRAFGNLGQQVDLCEHGLQSASRALRDGADEEMVVMSLLHDIGEMLCPKNHGEIPAAILRPYISPERYWILSHHEIFQGKYYVHHYGGDPDMRDRYKDHPQYEDCVYFCENYDQESFDETYDTLPLETFVPMVERVFARKPFWWDGSHPKANLISGPPASD